jgi:glycosyltransferase involved in cell wall biosynthesis
VGVRICLVYDCLFPYTVGGAERWYRNLGERLAQEGHDVTYLTLRQWPRGARVEVPGVKVIAVGPRMRLYADAGHRRVLPPLVFGAGVLVHLVRHGRRYDAVHTGSFPYFSVLAAATARMLGRFRLVVDWHEVWSREYWLEYLGRLGGRVGHAVQALCARTPHRAFCFSRLHARRLAEAGHRGDVVVLEGEYAGSLEPVPPQPAEPLVVFAGRHIAEKRPALVAATIAVVRRTRPELRGVIYGDGPERAAVRQLVHELGLDDAVAVPGFVDAARVEDSLERAACMLLPSRREGYGLILIEAAARGTPSIVVREPDNAAIELIDEGVNGFVAASGSADELAAAVLRVLDGGLELRHTTADWFRRNARRLSLESSLERVSDAYSAR